MSRSEALTIIAGGGTVPAYVAAAAVKAGRPVFVVGIKGEADPAITAFPHEFLDWGQLGRLDEILSSQRGRDLVFVGSVRTRPGFRRASALTSQPCAASRTSWRSSSAATTMCCPVQSVSSRSAACGWSARMRLATDLVVATGPLGRVRPARAARRDIETRASRRPRHRRHRCRPGGGRRERSRRGPRGGRGNRRNARARRQAQGRTPGEVGRPGRRDR